MVHTIATTHEVEPLLGVSMLHIAAAAGFFSARQPLCLSSPPQRSVFSISWFCFLVKHFLNSCLSDNTKHLNHKHRDPLCYGM